METKVCSGMNKSNITIIDYGMGNLWSVLSALRYLGCNPKVSNDPNEITRAESLVLPGVGSFRKAMDTLRQTELDQAILDAVQTKGIKILGICLGILGGFILIRIWEINFVDLISSGNIYFILAAFAWSIVTICTQKSNEDLHFLNFSLWLYMLAFLISFIFAPWNQLIQVLDHDLTFWIHFLIISVGAIGFGTTIFFLATMRIGSEKSSSFMYLVPTSAIGLSIILLNESLSSSTILGGALTISAVYLINQRK